VALIAYAAVYTALATTGLLLLRTRLESVTIADALMDPAVYMGAACYAASFCTFLLALRRFEVLTVFPVFTGITYASVAVGAAVILGEELTSLRVIGLLLVGAGAVMLVR
jgi:multidrug transporter EmrE-like cation transporter